jgi:hypothetical protein
VVHTHDESIIELVSETRGGLISDGCHFLVSQVYVHQRLDFLTCFGGGSAIPSNAIDYKFKRLPIKMALRQPPSPPPPPQLATKRGPGH